MLKTTCHLFGGIKYGWAVLFIFFLSCNEDNGIPYSETPEIELIGISHDTVVQYQEVLTLTIRYRDGDGDIGYESPDKYAVHVRDTRLEKFDGFYVGPVAPPGSEVPVEGKIDIEFPNLFVFGNGRAEKTFFEIKMMDRAGNESNVLVTDAVVILRD